MCHFPAAVKREASVETGDTIAFLYVTGQHRHGRLTTLNNKTSTGKGVSIFKFQKLCNYGTGTLAVVRTVLLVKPIVDMFNCSEEQRTSLLEMLFDFNATCLSALNAVIA